MKDEINALDNLIRDCSKKNKKGIVFISSSIIIWILITIIWLLDLPVKQANLFTFFATGIMMPTSIILSKIFKVKIVNKDNPLNNLAFLFTLNQVIYLLIVMWAFNAVPEKMLMILAIVFGAHLLPYSWVYNSKSYMFFSIIIPIVSLAIGLYFENYILSAVMALIEGIFAYVLYKENKKMGI